MLVVIKKKKVEVEIEVAAAKDQPYRFRTAFAATDRCKIFRLWRFLLPQCKRVNKETNTKEQEPMQNDKEVERSR
jgi:hypothetical protein